MRPDKLNACHGRTTRIILVRQSGAAIAALKRLEAEVRGDTRRAGAADHLHGVERVD